jgi:hypothetical protein
LAPDNDWTLTETPNGVLSNNGLMLMTGHVLVEQLDGRIVCMSGPYALIDARE